MLNVLADVTLVTYGGGEILEKVFNSVAMLLNGNHGGFLRPLIVLCATLTAVFILSKAMFSSSMESLLSKFLFPIIGLAAILMVPTVSVKIEDVLTLRSHKVDNVPLLLGQFSSLVSSFSYKITIALESVLHTAKGGVGGAASYEKTGMIFGSEAAVDFNKFKITNGDLEYNLGEFSKQCVLYDVALGMYSIDQLKKSTDLWDFFEKKTSILRMINYKSLDGSEGTKNNLFAYKTCREAIIEMKKSLGNEIAYFEKSDMIKNLPFAFQALTQISKSQENLVGQQIMMQALSEKLNGGDFAKNRADSHQKSYMNIVGSLASSSIIGTRVAIEALIYACFILIIPLTFLPGGFKFISSWAWLVVWIQTWPPFFAIINYIMLITARSKSDAFTGSGGFIVDKGLSFFTSVGIENIQDQVFAMGGFLAASVPFITYTLLKGGLHSIGSLASNIMSPISGAASMAASEQISGNYSFGNVSTGNLSHQNEGSFQTNVSPTHQSGLIKVNDQNNENTYGPEGWNIKHGNSSTLMSFSSDDMNAQSLNEAVNHSQSATTANETSYNEAVSLHSRNTANLVDTLSRSENYTDNASQANTFDIQRSASDMLSVSERFGESLGINQRDSLDILVAASASGGFKVFGTGASLEGKISKSGCDDVNKAMSAALDTANSKDFRESYNKVENFMKNEGASYLTDEGQRSSYDYSKSLDQVESAHDSFKTSLNETNQISANAACLQQVSQHVKYDQTQSLADWLVKTEKMSYAKFSAITSNGSAEERVNLTNHYADFNREKHPHLFNENEVQGYLNPREMYENDRNKVKKVDYNNEREGIVNEHMANNNSSNLQYGSPKLQRERIENKGAAIQNKSTDVQVHQRDNLGTSFQEIQNPVLKEANKFLVTRAAKHHVVDNFLSVGARECIGQDTYDRNTFNIKSKPFWKNEEKNKKGL